MLCGSRGCGCAIQSDSLEISGSGESGDPYVLNTNAFSIVTSVTRPSSPFANQFIYETDTGLAYRWSGSTWQLFAWTQEPACVLTATTVSVPHNDSGYRVPFATEVYDPFNWHSAGTNTRITPQLPGRYDVFVGGDWQATVADYMRTLVGVTKNDAHTVGSRDDHNYSITADHLPRSQEAFAMDLAMNGSTDYITVEAYQFCEAEAARTISVRVKMTWKGIA